MSVADSSMTETQASSKPMGLWTASLLGGIYVLAAMAVVFYAVPQIWDESIGSWIAAKLNKPIKYTGQVLLQIAAVIVLVIFGMRLAGPHPVKGLRGGITLAISSIFTGFFLLKGLIQIFERMITKFDAGQILSLIFVSACLFLFWKFLKSDRFYRWSVKLEDAGWFDTSTYKRNQGLRVRRLTILGIFLIFGSGVYTMVHNNLIGGGDWAVVIPFTGESDAKVRQQQLDEAYVLAKEFAEKNGTAVSLRKDEIERLVKDLSGMDASAERAAVLRLQELRSDRSVPENVRQALAKVKTRMYLPLLPNVSFTIPMVLIALTIWLAWRVVNFPTFADFLIATEAEINKVSWTPRAKLIRDTIVVLVTVVIITVFLFLVDIFWGFLLSRSWIGVLPSDEEQQGRKTQQVNPNEW